MDYTYTPTILYAAFTAATHATAGLLRLKPDLYSEDIKSYLARNDMPLSILDGIKRRNIRVIKHEGPFTALMLAHHHMAECIKNSWRSSKLSLRRKFFFSALDTISFPIKCILNIKERDSFLIKGSSHEDTAYIYLHPMKDNILLKLPMGFKPDNSRLRKAVNMFVVAHELKHADNSVSTETIPDDIVLAIENDSDDYGIQATETACPDIDIRLLVKNYRQEMFLSRALLNASLPQNKYETNDHFTAPFLEAKENGETLPTAQEIFDAERKLVEVLRPILAERKTTKGLSLVELIMLLQDVQLKEKLGEQASSMFMQALEACIFFADQNKAESLLIRPLPPAL